MSTQGNTFSLDHAGMAVPDLDAAIEWYGRVFEFTVSQRFSTESFTAAFIEREGAKIEIFQATPAPAAAAVEPVTSANFLSAMLKPGFTHIAFGVPDVDAAFQQAVSRGATSINPPASKPDGSRFGHLGDLNQYVIELVPGAPLSKSS